MTGKLYVVFAMDTEGPVTDKNPELLNIWDKVDSAMAKIFDEKYRNKYPDSYGGWLKVSWFILHWTGFKTNPVKRDFGYHKVFDHYTKKWGDKIKKYGDGIYWHYHHPPLNGVGNEWNIDWASNTEYYNILNRMIIDRKYFPSCFRSGGTIENNDTSHWLEQWIPFDYSNRAGEIDWNREEADGKLIKEICDWRKAPSDWSFYHPSEDDYQILGKMNRIICKCMDIRSGAHTIKNIEIEEAFERANNGQDTIMSFFDHDFRDIADHVENLFLKELVKVSQSYPDVKWKYANALEAIRSVLGYKYEEAPSFEIELSGNHLIINTNKKLFGYQPYFVVKFIDTGIYKHYPLDIIGKNVWHHTLERPDKKQIIGIASNDFWGNVGILLYFYDGKQTLNLIRRVKLE
jgi:hypothetical protein